MNIIEITRCVNACGLSYIRPEFTTLRLRLIKIGARIIETATRVRIAFTAACPEAALFASLVRGCLPAGP